MRLYNKPVKLLYLYFNSFLNQHSNAAPARKIRFLTIGRIGTVAFVITASLFTGCYKWADVPPPTTSFTGESVYQEDGTAAAVMSGLYTRLQSDLGAGRYGISMLTGLSADELDLVQPGGLEDLELFYLNNLTASVDWGVVWTRSFNYVHTVNSVLEGVTASESLTPLVKQQLLGEARFMRAFIYFYLVNLYGDVPMVMSSDYAENSRVGRTDLDEVYAQIIKDLNEATNLLSMEYLDAECKKASEDRVRPTKAAAHALLARVYLYRQDWLNAEINASEVIDNTATYELVDVEGVFLKNNKEAIWQIMPVDPGYNTWDGRLFVADPGFSFDHPVAITEALVNSFEPNDARKDNWIKLDPSSSRYYPFKYRLGDNIIPTDPPLPADEYLNVIRLAEFFLVRGEARVQSGNISGGISDINEIRRRANRNAAIPIPMLSENLTKEQALDAVEKERRVELFTEWGHRWLDLKRMKGINNTSRTRADEVLETIKAPNWTVDDKLYPIPEADMRLNPNLIPQNPGY